MAQKVTVQLLDDLDGSAAAETVSFGLDGIAYEIDLNDENAAKPHGGIAEFVKAGRRQGAVRRRKAPKSAMSTRPSRSGPAVR